MSRPEASARSGGWDRPLFGARMRLELPGRSFQRLGTQIVGENGPAGAARQVPAPGFPHRARADKSNGGDGWKRGRLLEHSDPPFPRSGVVGGRVGDVEGGTVGFVSEVVRGLADIVMMRRRRTCWCMKMTLRGLPRHG